MDKYHSFVCNIYESQQEYIKQFFISWKTNTKYEIFFKINYKI